MLPLGKYSFEEDGELSYRICANSHCKYFHCKIHICIQTTNIMYIFLPIKLDVLMECGVSGKDELVNADQILKN